MASEIVADVLKQVQNFEAYLGVRRRRRRPDDQKTFERTVSAVISDLIHRELTVPGAWVAIPLSKQLLGGAFRSRAPALNSTLPSVLERLAMPEMGFIEMEKGSRSPFGFGRQTVIRRGPRLLSRIVDHGGRLADIARDRTQLPDPLVMRGPKIAGKRGSRIAIRDSSTARRYRGEMDRINGWLAQADLAYDGGEDSVDDQDRILRRIFNRTSLERGGRLFGGFWQRLSKEHRLLDIAIQGEMTVALDFGQMAPRIAYGLVHAEPPQGDLYRVAPFEGHRKGIKVVMNALLSSEVWPKRFPMGTRSEFVPRVSVRQVVEAIEQAHPALAPLFGTGACHRIFFIESQVLIATLLRLIECGVVALPIHDCLLVPTTDRDTAREAMLASFKEIVGVEGVVEEEQVDG